ncbi:MAG: HAMP domain-containing histidine kinase [Bacteroidetes bacterium]|nr:HAMP domain-containing histidine kinase [Bacteroidota bacterium]
MNERSRHIIPIIAVITAAMAGLIALQVYLLLGAYEAKEQAFDRNVVNALTAVSQQIEKDEAASKIFSLVTAPNEERRTVKRPSGKLRINTAPAGEGTRREGVTWVVAESSAAGNGTQMRVEVFHSGGIDTLPTMIVRKQAAGKGSRRTNSFSYSYSTDVRRMEVNASVGDSVVTMMLDTTRKRKGEIVAKVVDKLFLLEVMPVEQRLDRHRLDSSIGASLRTIGITTPYLFRVSTGHRDSVKMTNDSTGRWAADSSYYSVRLFPNDVIPGRHDLTVILPDKVSYVLGEMAVLLVLSLVFVVTMIVSMGVTVRTLFQQKRFGEAIVEFINNMTHEFKTPLSTIALASEAIAKPEVMKSRLKLRRYNSLIAEENKRMRHQVDTILQMAVLERGEFELKKEKVDLHALVERAVENIAVQTEHRNGSVRMSLNALRPVVHADPLHLANIIHNLLDNAVKYSPNAPEIEVNTADVPGGVRIRVKDNGIGIAREHLTRVFEKYYRVPTGNTHDVKGFGLGLSYVALIVKAHGGTVAMDSVPGQGTVVDVILPA